MTDGFKFTIKWRKSNVWRGFYGEHEGRSIQVRHFKRGGWKLLVDKKQLGGSEHPLGFAALLRVAEEMFVNKHTAGDAVRIVAERVR